jgi:plasmid stabilization system protein ParE
MRSRKYTLTKGAEADLDEIHRRSLEQFGRPRTNKFMAELKKAAEFAADNIGKVATRSHLTGDSGLSLYPVRSFFIAYRPVSENHIVIIAIFPQSRDIVTLVMKEADRFRKDFEEIELGIGCGEISIEIAKPKSS